jgi:hypothetical protein
MAEILYLRSFAEGVELFVKKRAAWPSGKAKVCKTFIHRFESGRRLQKNQATALFNCPVHSGKGNASGWIYSGGYSCCIEVNFK